MIIRKNHDFILTVELGLYTYNDIELWKHVYRLLRMLFFHMFAKGGKKEQILKSGVAVLLPLNPTIPTLTLL